MKPRFYALIAIAVLIVFMAWQCYTWPVVESDEHWVYTRNSKVVDAELASRPPVERPPTTGEVVFRGVTCFASLLLAMALLRALSTKKVG
jgi:hypothetical protein